MAPHNLRQALTRSVAEECGAARAVPFNADARAYEAFGLGTKSTILDPVKATTLDMALAEITEREYQLDRGDRLGVREIGPECDLLHVYAVRRTNTVTAWRRAYDNPLASTAAVYKRRLEHICTIDLRTIAGIPPLRFSDNPSLDRHYRAEDEQRQRQRPEGARR